MSLTLVIRDSAPEDDAARDEYVQRAPGGTFFHLAGWRRAVERVMGHRGMDLLALEGERIVGVLPLVACRGLRGRVSWLSVPYAVYGGPIGDSPEVVRSLYEEAERRAVAARVGRLELRCLEDPGFDLPRSELYATFIKQLPDDPEDVLKGMPKKSRAEARKARNRHGLELSEGLWFLDDLLRLFHENKRGLGSPALPRRWFEVLLEEFPGQATVHVVRRGEEPLTAVMSFLFRDQVLAYYSGAAEGADRSYSASNFMYMALQEWSVEKGYRIFDFGRSRKDAGAFRFKQHQGFEARDLPYLYRLVRDTELPSLNPSNPKTRLIREAWSRLPIGLTTRLSGPASRLLP